MAAQAGRAGVIRALLPWIQNCLPLQPRNCTLPRAEWRFFLVGAGASRKKRGGASTWSLPLRLRIPDSSAPALCGAFFLPPSPARHNRPDGFHQPKRPRSLKKSVNRPQRACHGEQQDEPRAALLKRVTHQHGRHCKETKKCESVHESFPRLPPRHATLSCRRQASRHPFAFKAGFSPAGRR